MTTHSLIYRLVIGKNSQFRLNLTAGRLAKSRRWTALTTQASAALCLGFLIGAPGSALTQNQSVAPSANTSATASAEERESDKQNLLTIYKALKAYEKDHSKLPDWLSDLVPKYIPNGDVLVSPFSRRTGQDQLYGNEDPHLKTSYIYEFSAKPVPEVIRNAFPNLTPGTTMKEWKTRQIAEFGPVVPILRCFLHNPVLNVSSDGEFFESGAYWETDPKTLELRKKRLATGAKTQSRSP